jgi:sulfatase modifying factor 1
MFYVLLLYMPKSNNNYTKAGWIFRLSKNNNNRYLKEPVKEVENIPENVNLLMVEVRDASNNSDENKLGSVAYNYYIGKYPITIREYCAFLNAVASKTDKYNLYNVNMSLIQVSSGIRKSKNGNGFIYTAIGPNGKVSYGSNSITERPITNITIHSAIRFANWLTNGQPIGEQNNTTTEDGSYKIDINSETNIATITKKFDNAKDMYYIPTENEWYKAAYYSPNYNNTNAPGYYLYATQSNDPPKNVLSLDTTSNGSNLVNYISPETGNMCVTQETNIDSTQNYLTNVGAFIHSSSYYGTYDQTGNVWELITNNNENTIILNNSIKLRGGAWTSFLNFIMKTYTLSVNYDEIGTNAGLRLVKYPKSESSKIIYETVIINNPNNIADTNGLGNINYEYYIGKYNVTIGQYCAFLNAIASIDDKYNLYNTIMETDLNIAGINRSGKIGSYSYSVMNNLGDSTNRPITYVSPYNIFRFANWLTNGQPVGQQDNTTTEDGSYTIRVDSETNATTVTVNYDTSKDMYYMPTENEWYKSAYYSPNYNNTGSPGYYLYATQSNDNPSNLLSDAQTSTNVVNYVDGVNYCLTQSAHYDVKQNYLTNVGTFSKSKSYYGTFDQTGLVYNLLQSDRDDNIIITRGGFWAGGSVSMKKTTSAIITQSATAASDGVRLVMYKKV